MPYPRAVVALALLFAALLTSSASAELKEYDRGSQNRSFEVEPARATVLAVDNLFGRIEIRTHDEPRIDLELTKSVHARSRESFERALNEVSLDVSQEPGLVDLYVNGPFRHPVERKWSGRWRDHGYKVVYDFDLTVPRGTEIRVKTVDGGDLLVAGVSGRFDVTNVNGGIEMYDVEGSGSAKTVNGPVRVEFTRNPTESSHFETVSGDVEIAFRGGLSADLEMISTFGELWSEWKVEPLASRPPVETLESGRRVIRTGGGARVRVGTGGPQHSFETLSGDVLIRRSELDAASENS